MQFLREASTPAARVEVFTQTRPFSDMGGSEKGPILRHLPDPRYYFNVHTPGVRQADNRRLRGASWPARPTSAHRRRASDGNKRKDPASRARPVPRSAARLLRSLNLDQLRAFVEVVERGSFTAAAEELNRTQPA